MDFSQILKIKLFGYSIERNCLKYDVEHRCNLAALFIYGICVVDYTSVDALEK